MRWFVEISSLGKNTSPTTTLCVEAPQWQPALQKARSLRGDDGALSNFSIELLDDGYRAIDPALRLRYVVRKAPDDAVLTNGASVPPAPLRSAPSTPPPRGPRPPSTVGTPHTPATSQVPSSSQGEAARKRPAAQTIGFASPGAALVASQQASEPSSGGKRAAASTVTYSSKGAAAIRDEATRPRPKAIPSDLVPPRPPPPRDEGLSFRVLHKREDEPSARSPLTYREVAYAVAEGTGHDAAGAFLSERFQDVCKGLDPSRPGKLVNLAVFDHVYQGRPRRPPLATLSWKDWKGVEPEMRFPLRDGPGNTPTPLAVPVAPPVAPPAPKADTPRPAPQPVPPTPGPVVEARAPAIAPPPPPAPVAEEPARAPSIPPPARVPSEPARAAVQARVSGDELLAELFEAFSDLHFLQDTFAGADFVLALTLEKLPSEVGAVSLFDINKREFVLVRQSGGQRSALLARISEKAPVAAAAMRSHQAVVVADAATDERAQDERWKAMGVVLKSVICAPVEVGGRYLGLIELANPLDGRSFTDGDGHALTYIGQQFAEFVAAHGVMTDPEHVMQGAKEHR